MFPRDSNCVKTRRVPMSPRGIHGHYRNQEIILHQPKKRLSCSYLILELKGSKIQYPLHDKPDQLENNFLPLFWSVDLSFWCNTQSLKSWKTLSGRRNSSDVTCTHGMFANLYKWAPLNHFGHAVPRPEARQRLKIGHYHERNRSRPHRFFTEK